MVSNRGVRSARIALLTLVFVGVASTTVFAQVLEEIVVTATKREESLLDVPLSIATIDGNVIDDRGLEQMVQIADYVPNLQIGVGDGVFKAIRMRGLGSGNNRGFETSVGLFVDGVYLGRDLFLLDQIFDIDRVEVVKGPQGALYGKNTIAGALSVVTADPTEEFESGVGLTVGEFRKIQLDAYASGPLSDNWSGRIYAQAMDRDGFYENTATGERDAARNVGSVRGKLLWNPDGDFNLGLSLQFTDIESRGSSRQLVGRQAPCVDIRDPAAPPGSPTCATPGTTNIFSARGTLSSVGLARTVDPMAEAEADDRLSIVCGFCQPGSSRRHVFSRVEANWVLGGNTLTYLASYAEIMDELMGLDGDVGPLPITDLTIGEDYYQWQHELRITSAQNVPLEYIAGLYYYTNNIDGYQDLYVGAPFPGPPQGFIYGRADQDTTSVSAFGQLTWNASDRARAILGFRYIDEEKDAILSQTREPTAFIFPEYSDSVKFGDDEILTNAAIELDFSEEAMFYASYTEGFKMGGFNFYALMGSPPDTNYTYQSERSDGFEIGLKSTVLEGAGSITLAYFDTDYRNLQASTLVGNALQVGNAAEANTSGAEIEFNWQPTAAFFTRVSLAFLDAVYEDYKTAPCTDDQRLNTAQNPCTQDLSGKSLQSAPDMTAVWNLDYTWLLPDFVGDIALGLDFVYSDGYNPSGDLDPVVAHSSWVKLNAQIALRSHDERWNLAIQGSNLTDEVVHTANDVFQFPGSFAGHVEPPRQIEAKFTRTW